MNTQQTIKLAIVDDHQIVIEGVMAVMKNDPSLEVVVTATDAQQMLHLLQQHPVDILLTDVMMPGMNGQQLAKAVKQQYPAIKTIALSMSNEGSMVEAMINDADIAGYLLKQTNIAELSFAIKKVYDGGIYFQAAVLDELAQQQQIKKQITDTGLTLREKQLIAQIENGLSNKEIAAALNISIRTVETHRKNIFAKTGCNNPMSLVKWAYEHGILSKP
ncbi:MAG: hypothetical protein RL172_1926 [Bacteroidota bacterium]|jgi:two-component system, NarL family, nitrate/nitrite response regulator NarL